MRRVEEKNFEGFSYLIRDDEERLRVTRSHWNFRIRNQNENNKIKCQPNVCKMSVTSGEGIVWSLCGIERATILFWDRNVHE